MSEPLSILNRFRRWHQDKINAQEALDQATYGLSCHTQYYRSVFNPMRYILGDIGYKRINPSKMFIRKME